MDQGIPSNSVTTEAEQSMLVEGARFGVPVNIKDTMWFRVQLGTTATKIFKRVHQADLERVD